MGWKLLWVVLVAFLLGEWCGCDGCWDQEKTALLQLKPFFNRIKDVKNYWEEGNQSSDCCEWERIECNSSTRRVIRLFLNFTIRDIWDDRTFYADEEYMWRDYWYLNTSLFLPFEELKSLDLSGNFIAGCIDNQGFEKMALKLDKLEILDLSYNYFNDSIFASLSELSSLKSLSVAGNQFIWSNPSDGLEKLSTKLDKLEILDFSGNYFNDSIFASLSEFSSLKFLNLARNQFTGTNAGGGIKRLSKLKILETLDLHDNRFGNNIISNLGSFTSLRSLNLQFCGLKGTVEMLGRLAQFNNLTNLKELYLNSNEIESLGSLFQERRELGLIKLEVLALDGNLFNNSVFSFLSLLSNLRSLSLGNNRLEGPIKIKELNALSNLEELTLWNNQVNDFVPSHDNEKDLKLMNLEVLNLKGNLFNSSILSSVGRLSNLKSLYLSLPSVGTKLDGSIDLTDLNALTNLEDLSISCGYYIYMFADNNCSLLLSSLDLFPSLKTLFLDGFSFQGSIMTSLNLLLLDQSNKFTNLEELILHGSFLQTNFLRSIGEFTSLKHLALYDCEINGSLTLQDQQHNFTNLEELIMRGSSLQANFLRGIKEFTSLKHLALYDCEINGSLIFQESHYFTNLEELIVEDSIFETDFFRSIGQLTSLKRLALYNCKINESLTLLGFCELTNLQELSIKNLNMKGNLPDCFSSLTSLRTLDLSSNQLSENILVLRSLTALQTLNLSSNQFSGNISALESLTSLERLYLSSNQFSGNISALKSLASLQVLSLSNNYFEIPISLNPLSNLSKLRFISASNNSMHAETQMHPLAPTFQLKQITLSCCGNVGPFPEFLYHQHELQYLDVSNIYFKGNQFPNWLLENNTKLETLILTNCSLFGPFQLPLTSHMHLSVLEISNNFFNGNIPVEIGAQLPSLWFLNMSKNYFNGSIPSSFGDMNSLGILDLSNNQLSDGIPEHLAMNCPSLQVLALSNNTLKGEIFSANFNLTNLEELQLDGNNFSGRIPDFLSKSSYLTTLDVSNNQLSGRIPRWMGNMLSLHRIILSNNHFEGTIPVEFCQLNLVRLDLSINNISGSLPSCFGPANIRQVHLSKNRLQGGLPNALRNSSSLVTLDISDNYLTGGIPSWIGGLSKLSYLLLGKNKFEGEIPMDLCNLRSLSLINLSHNNLSGRIPPCLKITTFKDVSEDYVDYLIAIGSLSPFSFNEPIEFLIKNMYNSYKGRIIPYLSGIDLSCNKLVGEIPYEFGNFYKILVLNLSHNSLTGPIPPTFANLRKIESLDLSYNHLNGTVSPQLIGLNFLSSFNVSFNNLSGRTPERIAQFGTFDESSYRGNPFLCGEPLPKYADAGPPSPMPNALTDNKEDDSSIDMGVFYVSFIVSYIVMLLAIAAVLYINPYWRQAWFYRGKIITTSCYYFVIDNVLPRRFHCGNM